MKLLLLLPADYANVTGDGKVNVMGIFNQISAASFPARHSSMFLVIKLAAELGEGSDNRALTVRLVDPDGKEVVTVSGTVKIPDPVGGITPEVNAILQLTDVVFPRPGAYEFVVLVDKDHKGDAPIYVSQKAPQTVKE